MKDHNQKLLAQVRKCKTKKHKLEQEKEGSEKKLNKSLSEKEEENLRLIDLNQRLLQQIRNLKDDRLKSQNIENKVDESKIKELLRLRNHNQSLLTQIKKLIS